MPTYTDIVGAVAEYGPLLVVGAAILLPLGWWVMRSGDIRRPDPAVRHLRDQHTETLPVVRHRAPEPVEEPTSAPGEATPVPVEEQTTVEVHQGATEQWSPVAEVGSLPNGDLDPGEDRTPIDELTWDEIADEAWEQEVRLFRAAGTTAAGRFEQQVLATGATDVVTIRDAENRHDRRAAHAALSAGTLGDTQAIDRRVLLAMLAAGPQVEHDNDGSDDAQDMVRDWANAGEAL